WFVVQSHEEPLADQCPACQMLLSQFCEKAMDPVKNLDRLGEPPLIRKQGGVEVGQASNDEGIAGSPPGPRNGGFQGFGSGEEVVRHPMGVGKLSEGSCP